jgi:hypothetical protein
MIDWLFWLEYISSECANMGGGMEAKCYYVLECNNTIRACTFGTTPTNHQRGKSSNILGFLSTRIHSLKRINCVSHHCVLIHRLLSDEYRDRFLLWEHRREHRAIRPRIDFHRRVWARE